MLLLSTTKIYILQTEYQCCQLTVRKFKKFLVAQISREITFRELDIANLAFLIVLEALKFDFGKFGHLSRLKMAVFTAPKWPKLISRKIWVAKNGQISTLCNFEHSFQSMEIFSSRIYREINSWQNCSLKNGYLDGFRSYISNFGKLGKF